jgi:hypothetical protein
MAATGCSSAGLGRYGDGNGDDDRSHANFNGVGRGFAFSFPFADGDGKILGEDAFTVPNPKVLDLRPHCWRQSYKHPKLSRPFSFLHCASSFFVCDFLENVFHVK